MQLVVFLKDSDRSNGHDRGSTAIAHFLDTPSFAMSSSEITSFRFGALQAVEHSNVELCIQVSKTVLIRKSPYRSDQSALKSTIPVKSVDSKCGCSYSKTTRSIATSFLIWKPI